MAILLCLLLLQEKQNLTLTGSLKRIRICFCPFPFWDPHIYFEDNRAYLYWACSSKNPIYGVERDIRTRKPMGKKVPLIYGNKDDHGIDDKTIYAPEHPTLGQRYISFFIGTGAYIEGAFLHKINGTYYFQYATPGTEFPTYRDAVLVSDKPLGPFTWQKHIRILLFLLAIRREPGMDLPSLISTESSGMPLLSLSVSTIISNAV